MLYIRHGEKLYGNNNHSQYLLSLPSVGSSDASTYSLDPGLTEKGKSNAKLRFYDLLQKFGPPERIISSPYLRARETALIAQQVIYDHTGIFVDIVHDPLIGEYLGNQHHVDLSQAFHPDTQIHHPVPPENKLQYKIRIKRHLKSSQSNTWYISHGYTIQSIAFLRGCKIPYPTFLRGVHIDNGTITPI